MSKEVYTGCARWTMYSDRQCTSSTINNTATGVRRPHWVRWQGAGAHWLGPQSLPHRKDAHFLSSLSSATAWEGPTSAVGDTPGGPSGQKPSPGRSQSFRSKGLVLRGHRGYSKSPASPRPLCSHSPLVGCNSSLLQGTCALVHLLALLRSPLLFSCIPPPQS